MLGAIVAFFILLLAGGPIALWYWYDARSVSQYAPYRNQALFICVRCGTVYRSPRSKDVSNCPSCGYDNIRLHF